jgi:hypothetical protein
VPDGVRSSPTGRVPQWVLDEAAGLPVTPVPFRGSTAGLGGPPGRRPRRRLRGGIAGGVVLALGCAVAVVYAADLPEGGGLVMANAPGTVAREGWPTPGKDEAESPLGSPAAAPDLPEGAAYRFIAHQDDGVAPVAWSPCRPIRFVTRPDNAIIGGAALITQSARELSAVTGLSIVDGGLTTEGPSREREAYQPERYGDRWAPVLIAWATPEEIPDFSIDVAGQGGAQQVRTSSGDEAYVSGILYLDPTKIEQARIVWGEDVARSVILHEFAHLLGLDHVTDESSLMFPQASTEWAGLSEGDRAGLAALGRGACQPDV